MPDNTVDDKEVEKASKRVSDLSDKVEAAKRELVVSEAGRHNTVQLASLNAEEERLKAELGTLKEQIKASQIDPTKDQVVQQIEASTPSALAAEEEAADKAAGVTGETK